jgi:polyhydroxybutyrate depolymerase
VKSLLLISWIVALSSFASASANRSSSAGAKETLHEISIDKNRRSYLMHVPSDLGVGEVPLMIFLHGGTGNAEHASRTTGLNAVAEKNHFIVVYPNGTGTLMGANRRVWDAGDCCAIAQRQNVKDVLFIESMIKEILRDYPVDAKRVYVTGMSNGAMMTYRLMCERPNLFAAAIPVSGTLEIPSCEKGSSVALLHIHGSADDNVPLKGGVGHGLSRVNFRSIPDTMKLVTDTRHCKDQIRHLPNGDSETNYACTSGAPVRLRILSGGKHEWPTGSGRGGFNAAEEAWNFAKNFSKP